MIYKGTFLCSCQASLDLLHETRDTRHGFILNVAMTKRSGAVTATWVLLGHIQSYVIRIRRQHHRRGRNPNINIHNITGGIASLIETIVEGRPLKHLHSKRVPSNNTVHNNRSWTRLVINISAADEGGASDMHSSFLFSFIFFFFFFHFFIFHFLCLSSVLCATGKGPTFGYIKMYMKIEY